MPRKRSKGAGGNVASLNPNEMVMGGLPDDFRGTITRVRFVPWDYNGALDEYVLAVAVDIEPDEDQEVEEPFTQHYSAGSLTHFVPSVDGEEPVDLDGWDEETVEDVEGLYAMRVGRKEQLNRNTNWGVFVRALFEAGFEDFTASVDCFEGIHAHFNRVPQPSRSGIATRQSDDGRDRRNDILVVTEVLEAATPKKPGKKKAAPKKASPKAEAAGDDLADRVSSAISEALESAGEDGLPRAKVARAVLASFKGKERAQAVKMLQDSEFLTESEFWVYDDEEGILYPA